MGTVTTNIIILVSGFLVWWLLRRMYRKTARAYALSLYARKLSRGDARKIHDLALKGFYLNLQKKIDPFALLESIVALRDCIDQLEGREHGSVNKAKIRMLLVLQTRQNTPAASSADYISTCKELSFGDGIPESDRDRLGLHVTMMERIYDNPKKPEPLPELSKYT